MIGTETEPEVRTVPDWDALAPFWEHFEDGGLNLAILAEVETDLRPPVLHVGGGRGTLTARLAERLGPGQVVSVDGSAAMCQRARRDHGVTCVAADVSRLPLPDGHYATVVCATGVLEYLEPEQLGRVLAELARVCRPGGLVVAAAAYSDGDVHWDIDQHRLVEAWYADPSGEASPAARALDAVAAKLGTREAARDLLLRSLPRHGRALSTAALTEAASAAGLTLTATTMTGGIALWHLARA